MELAIVVYLLAFITNVKIVTSLCVLVFSVVLIVHLVDIASCPFSKPVLFNKKYLYALAVSLVVWIITPGERTLWLMTGAYAAQTAVQSQVGQDVMKIVELKVKKELENLTESNNK
jgi:hypothetical protein